MTVTIQTAALCFIVGSIIGSFLSVCAYRIPVGRYDPVVDGIPIPPNTVSIWEPSRSFCPACQKQLLWWHNIPIISWFLLRGACGFCKTKIPCRYPFIELFTGLVGLLVYLQYGLTLTALVLFAVLCSMIVITFIDLDYMIIPNVISYPGTVLGLLLAGGNQLLSSETGPLLGFPFCPDIKASLIGALGGAGLLYSVFWLYLKIRKRDGLGLGDVKLLAMVGTIFGLECAWFTIFVGSMIGSVVGVSIAVAQRKGLSTYIPFGPYLVAALMAYVLDPVGVYEVLRHGTTPNYWWISSQ